MLVRANPRNLESVAHPAIPPLESGGRAGLTLKFFDELFDCKLGGRLGRGVIRRYDANPNRSTLLSRVLRLRLRRDGEERAKIPG